MEEHREFVLRLQLSVFPGVVDARCLGLSPTCNPYHFERQSIAALVPTSLKPPDGPNNIEKAMIELDGGKRIVESLQTHKQVACSNQPLDLEPHELQWRKRN